MALFKTQLTMEAVKDIVAEKFGLPTMFEEEALEDWEAVILSDPDGKPILQITVGLD